MGVLSFFATYGIYATHGCARRGSSSALLCYLKAPDSVDFIS